MRAPIGLFDQVDVAYALACGVSLLDTDGLDRQVERDRRRQRQLRNSARNAR